MQIIVNDLKISTPEPEEHQNLLYELAGLVKNNHKKDFVALEIVNEILANAEKNNGDSPEDIEHIKKRLRELINNDYLEEAIEQIRPVRPNDSKLHKKLDDLEQQLFTRMRK